MTFVWLMWWIIMRRPCLQNCSFCIILAYKILTLVTFAIFFTINLIIWKKRERIILRLCFWELWFCLSYNRCVALLQGRHGWKIVLILKILSILWLYLYFYSILCVWLSKRFSSYAVWFSTFFLVLPAFVKAIPWKLHLMGCNPCCYVFHFSFYHLSISIFC